MCLGIFNADGQWFTGLHGVTLTQPLRIVHLRMQAPVRVRTHHMHLPGTRITQVFARLLPLGHGWHVWNVHLRNRGRVHLDPATARVQWVFHGIGTEVTVTHPLMRFRRNRYRCHAIGPKLIERRMLGRATGFIGSTHIVHGRFAFSESVFDTKQHGQAAKNFKIIQSIMLGRNDLLHGIHLVDAVGTCRRNVVALHRGGGCQHNVSPTGRTIPPRLMTNDGVHVVCRTSQLIQVLLVREGIVTCVVNELDGGIGVLTSVVSELLAGVEQHLADTRGWANLFDRIAPL